MDLLQCGPTLCIFALAVPTFAEGDYLPIPSAEHTKHTKHTKGTRHTALTLRHAPFVWFSQPARIHHPPHAILVPKDTGL